MTEAQRFTIDQFARDIAVKKYGLPVTVHIPIAAREQCDIHTFIGKVVKVIVAGTPNRALLIEPHVIPKDDGLPIWSIPESAVLHAPRQVWVHVDYPDYKKAYIKGIGPLPNASDVLDHVMNRRVARLKCFSYLRIIPISREANSSSGGLSEKWAVEYHSSPEMLTVNRESPARIQYADLADIVKMLNMKTGGSLQYPVNEAQALVSYK